MNQFHFILPPSSFILAFDAEFTDEAVEVGAADLEALGGGGLVAALALDGVAHQPALERVDGSFERGLVAGGGGRRGGGVCGGRLPEHLVGQELRAEARPRVEDDEALDDVFEFANVARPVVLL
jgi:hypothetical protein